jgi:hypothetical protein
VSNSAVRGYFEILFRRSDKTLMGRGQAFPDEEDYDLIISGIPLQEYDYPSDLLDQLWDSRSGLFRQAPRRVRRHDVISMHPSKGARVMPVTLVVVDQEMDASILGKFTLLQRAEKCKFLLATVPQDKVFKSFHRSR